MNLVEKLRPKRKALVMAAESVAERMFAVNGSVGTGGKLTKSQLNHLIAVCGDAICVEEIENYIRYQAGRGATGWTTALADQIIGGPGEALTGIDEDRMRVEAWRLYAVFLTRAFTYRNAVRSAEKHGRSGGHSGVGAPGQQRSGRAGGRR